MTKAGKRSMKYASRDLALAWMFFGIALCVLLPASVTGSQVWSSERCQARVYRLTGKHIQCLLNVESTFIKHRNTRTSDQRVARCNARYQRRYERALERWPGACPEKQDSALSTQVRLDLHAGQLAEHVRTLVSDRAPTPKPGYVTLYNRCDVALKFMSPSNPATLNGIVVQPSHHRDLEIARDLNLAAHNTILVAPQTTVEECKAAQCEEWAAIRYSPLTNNAKQRAGYMWEAPNAGKAAYCQATNAAAEQCSTDYANTPCCGPKMNYDATFGTLWEITPHSGHHDYLNLSTNYGSGPRLPPELCSAPGATADDCVTVNANIFFNVPVKIEMVGGSCVCGSLNQRDSISCLDASCPDAYRHPTDRKQCACSAGGARSYLATYCPSGGLLPAF